MTATFAAHKRKFKFGKLTKMCVNVCFIKENLNLQISHEIKNMLWNIYNSYLLAKFQPQNVYLIIFSSILNET